MPVEKFQIERPKNVLPKPAIERTELKTRKTSFSKTYINPDGSFTLEVSAKQLNFINRSGNLEDIDNSLVPSKAVGYDYENSANAFTVRFAKNNINDKLVYFATDDTHWVAFTPVDRFTQLGNVKGQSIYYQGVRQGLDLQYIVEGDTVKENIIFNTYPTTNSFSFLLDYQGINLEKLSDGSINGIDNRTGERLFYFRKPFASDANNNTTDKVSMDIVRDTTQERLVYIIDAEFLKNASYPLILDPAVTATINYTDAESTIDTFIASGTPNAVYYNYVNIHAGKIDDYYKTAKALIWFRYLPPLPPGARINDTYMQLTMWQPQVSNSVNVYRITSSWSVTTATWNNPPSIDTINPVLQNFSLGPASVWDFNITQTVKEWYNGTTPNYGFMLSPTNEQAAPLSFYSSNETDPLRKIPSLKINYKIDGLGAEPYWGFHGNVNVYNGNLVISDVDVTLPGRGVPIVVTRTYNSRTSSTSVLGLNWINNLMMKVTSYFNKEIVNFTDADGTVKVFTKGPEGIYRSPAGVNSTMLVENDVIVIKEQSGVKYYFTADGRLDKILDTNNNTTDMRYLDAEKLGSIVDPSGRTITFNYAGEKLESITGPDIPTVDYVYTGSLLSKVRILDVSGAVLKEVTYTYDQYQNLQSIVDAEGNSTSYGYTYSTEGGLRIETITKKLTINGQQQFLVTRFSYTLNTDNTVITTVTDPKVYKTQYKTDAMGRVAELTLFENTGTEEAPVLVERKYLYEWSEEQDLVGIIEPKWSNLPESEREKYQTVIEYVNGNMRRVINKQGFSTIFKFDINEDPEQIVDFGQLTTVNEHDPANRNLLMTTTPIFSTVSMDHDSYGNMQYQSDPIGLAGNLVQDSGFENIGKTGTLLDWNIYQGDPANVLLDTTQKVNGNQSMKLIAKGDLAAQRTIIIGDYINVTPNFKYNVSAYIRTSNAGYSFGGATLEVRWYKDINILSTIPLSAELTPSVANSLIFTRKGARVNAPSDAQYARVTLNLSGGTDTTPAEAWFDNVQFESQPVLNEQNLLYNEGFESDINNNNLPDGWWLSASMDANDKLDTIYVRSGKRSFMVKGSTANKLLSQNINQEGGVGLSMHFSGWGRTTGTSTPGGKCQLLLQFNLDGTPQVTYVKDFPITSDGSWQYIESSGAAIRKFNSVTIYCKVENQPNLTVWFDDIKVRINAASNAVMSQYNLVQNGSLEFEQFGNADFDEWQILKSTTGTTYTLNWIAAEIITIGNDKKLIIPFSGDRMLKLSNTSDWVLLVNNIKEPIKQNTSYTLSAAIRTENVTGSGALVKFDILDASGSFAGQKASKIIKGTRDWNRFVETITYDEAQAIAKAYTGNPATVAKYIQVSIGSAGATYGAIYIDAVRLSEGNETIRYFYESTANYVNKITNQAGNSITMLNDNRGNKLELTDAKLNKYTFTYDKLDKVKTIEYPPIETGQGTKKLQTIYNFYKTENLDQIDNLVFDSATSSYIYYNTTVKINYNELNLPKSISDANWRPTYFDYDKNANLTKVSFPNGKSLSYTYDSLDRLKTETLGMDGTAWSYSFDENSNVKEVQKNGVKNHSFLYDVLNRVEKKQVWRTVSASNDEDYKYNANSQITEITYSVLSASPINAAAPHIEYTYDYAGNNTDIKGPNGTAAAFMIDEESRLKKSYVADSNMFYVTYREYDSGNRISRIKVENRYGSRIAEYSYEFDENGNRTKEINNRTSKRVEYTYDSINQLKAESYFDSLTAQTPSRRITYVYDIMGNRTERIVEGTGAGTTSYQYNAFNELLSRTGNVSYTHDYYGNMVTAGGNTFVYNDKNQLIRVESGATVIATYEYNWQGLRSKKITVGKTENYYYTGDDLAYITDEANKVKYFFVRDINGVLLQMIDYTGATPATYFYIQDAHGNVVALADSTGVRKVNFEYDAWGLLINIPENNVFTGNGEPLIDANPFRYSGYQFDAETEFYYLKGRYYSQYLGRFLTEDPVISKNRYVYCNNNPVNYVDHSGLRPLYNAGGEPETKTMRRQSLASMYPVIDVTNRLDVIMKENSKIARKYAETKNDFDVAIWWYKQVKTGGPWDLKIQPGWAFRKMTYYCSGCREYTLWLCWISIRVYSD